MAIIGNAPLRKDLSGFIDACDLVLRFNEGKNHGANSGRKADILCIGNSGAPARRLINNRAIRNAFFYDSMSEVWFPRDSGIHKKYGQTAETESFLTVYDDLADELIASNELSGFTIRHFSGELNEIVFRKLKEQALQPFECPSTGFLAVEYILNEPRFVGYEKVLIGFSFQGYRGHPWKAEQRIVQGYSESRTDFKIIPASRIPFSWKGKMEALKLWIKGKKRKG